jgi:hypothetical protein
MDVVPYLSAVILISTIATIALAVLSYAAFKLRDKRRPKPKGGEAPIFFHRYRLPEEAAPAAPAEEAADAGAAAAEPETPDGSEPAR